ncbi:hypothetical protein DIPPA_22938 [Diplonema papillatum]|nr:hypothetical protein DIPPA_22938 [Diplonema papillatum]
MTDLLYHRQHSAFIPVHGRLRECSLPAAEPDHLFSPTGSEDGDAGLPVSPRIEFCSLSSWLQPPAIPRSGSQSSTGSIGNVLAFASSCAPEDRWRAEYLRIVSPTLQRVGRGFLERRRVVDAQPSVDPPTRHLFQ